MGSGTGLASRAFSHVSTHLGIEFGVVNHRLMECDQIPSPKNWSS